MAFLREMHGMRQFPLPGKILVIGRDPSCDIVVRRDQTSSRHAMILQSGDDFYVEDLDSVNGTYVNGQRIRQRMRLKAGDRIDVFGLSVQFCDEPTQNDMTATLLQPAGAVPSGETPSALMMSTLDVKAEPQLTVAPETKLRAILEISQNLGSLLDLKEVLPKILESLFVIFPQADRGFILLRDPKTGQFVPRAVRQRHPHGEGQPDFSRTIVKYALNTGRAVLSADAGRDERFDPSQSIHRLQIRSIMCAPMVSPSGSPLGVLQIDTQDKRNQFRQEDLDVLVSACTQAARAVELAQLHEERRDLEAARQIQNSFLPDARPVATHLRFFDYYAPAQHISGDYYDYIRLPGNRLAVALGDVSGKGVSAALLMARLSAAARFSLASEPSVPAAVRQLNNLLTRPGSEGRFVTCVVAVLNLDDFSMTLVNAGHLPPLRRRADGVVEEVGDAIAGLPLGVFDRPYEEMVVRLELGDTMIFYTDGVTEARNPQGELYGVDRLRQVVTNAIPDVEVLGTAILADVRRFAGDRPLGDDLTIVCFGRVR
jgi:serine phosphatase RsbU (regulator of sigma subunit)